MFNYQLLKQAWSELRGSIGPNTPTSLGIQFKHILRFSRIKWNCRKNLYYCVKYCEEDFCCTGRKSFCKRRVSSSGHRCSTFDCIFWSITSLPARLVLSCILTEFQLINAQGTLSSVTSWGLVESVSTSLNSTCLVQCKNELISLLRHNFLSFCLFFHLSLPGWGRGHSSSGGQADPVAKMPRPWSRLEDPSHNRKPDKNIMKNLP